MMQTIRYQLAPTVNYQMLGEGEDGVLLCMQSGYLYRCNQSAIAILEFLNKRPTMEEILSYFAEHCCLARDDVRADVSSFLDDLTDQKLIVKAA